MAVNCKLSFGKNLFPTILIIVPEKKDQQCFSVEDLKVILAYKYNMLFYVLYDVTFLILGLERYAAYQWCYDALNLTLMPLSVLNVHNTTQQLLCLRIESNTE